MPTVTLRKVQGIDLVEVSGVRENKPRLNRNPTLSVTGPLEMREVNIGSRGWR